MKKSIVSAIMVMGMCASAAAQDHITAITYQPSIPLGDLEEYVSETSWIGWGIEGKRYRSASSNVTLGVSFAWHVFDGTWQGTTVLERGAVTGTQSRFVNSLPLLLTSNYYLGRKNRIKPFVGVGAGGYYIVQRMDIGVTTRQKSNWHFGFAGEVGLSFPLGEIDGVVAARYHYAFHSGETISGREIDYSYVTALIGLAYMVW
jgi:outer membrane protein W